MNVKKYIAYTIMTASVIGTVIGISARINLTPTAVASTNSAQLPTTDSNLVQAKEKLDSIPLVKEKVLNTNRNYSLLEGKISTTLEETGEKQVIELTIQQPDKFHVKYYPDAKNNPKEFTEAVNDGTTIQVKDSDSKEVKNFSAPKKKEKQEDAVIPTDYNGTYLPIGGVNELLHPEMFIQGAFSRGVVTIKGTEPFLDRNATVMVIDYKQGKLGNKQTFWIDNETGIILKLVSSNGDHPVQTIAFEAIKFSK